MAKYGGGFGGGMGNMQAILKQAQQMQQKMQEAQAYGEISNKEEAISFLKRLKL